MAPDLRRKVDAAREARLAREAEMKKQVNAQVRASFPLIHPVIPQVELLFGFYLFSLRTSRNESEKQTEHNC